MARKKHQVEETKSEGGGSMRWLLTYADMITLLMLFFIILYAMSNLNQAKFTEMQEAFQSVFNGGNFTIFDTRTAGGAGVSQGVSAGQHVQSRQRGPATGTGGTSAIRTQATSTLQNLIKSGKVTIIPTENGFAISLISDLYFDTASAQLRPGAMPVLQEVADFLGQVPNSIIVEGHTDNIQPDLRKWPGGNWQLASDRSVAVLQALEDYGLPAARLSAASYGSTRPMQSNDTAEGRAFNRRVDIVIVEKQ